MNTYVTALQRLLAGSPEHIAQLFTEDCAVVVEGGPIKGGAAFAQALERNRTENGWEAQEYDGWSEGDGLLAVLARNRYRDGRELRTAGVLRYNDAGQVTYAAAVGGVPS